MSKKEQKENRWKYVDRKAITHERIRADAHYVTAVRAMKEAAIRGGLGWEYMSAAMSFANGFDGWSVFATKDQNELVHQLQTKWSHLRKVNSGLMNG